MRFKKTRHIITYLMLSAATTCTFAGPKSYATVGMVNANGTLCTPSLKKCGLFVSRTIMDGAGNRMDGVPSSGDGYATAVQICHDEGALVDGGSHTWLPWLSKTNYNAEQTLLPSVNYYQAGGGMFVLDRQSLVLGPMNTTGGSAGYAVKALGAPLNGSYNYQTMAGPNSNYYSPSQLLWTGTGADGTLKIDGEAVNCSNWTSNNASSGATGYQGATDRAWTDAIVYANCAAFLPVLCIQQLAEIAP